MEELNLKDKESRMRTRRLIEIGGLAVKAKIDHLPTNSLFGAFIYLKDTLNTTSNCSRSLD
ncbi:conjugal transfer TraD family protein [Orientia chuto str. Dubai]|uniref:Conjugal transfer TraD family protein n=1 Tax=Orientia chuto str. Dubai TaxID=1359168 RepID=A0A0F3MHI9_9RICK|nr:conjugal transfer TraD family protein [Orientia chuto str. Dubai]